MKNKIYLSLLFSILIAGNFYAIEPENKITNPLLAGFNEIVDFSSITAEHITAATDIAIEKAKTRLEKLYTIKNRTFENTMLAYDDLTNEASGVFGEIYLMANVHPNDLTRNTANESIAKFSGFFTEIGLDENLYKAIKDYSLTDEAKKLSGYKKKFVEENVRSFERNGFALSKEKRNELQVLQNKLSDLTILFNKNIAEVTETLIVTDNEIDGLDEEYKKQHRTEDGNYKIGLSYPSYVPFMKFSKSESARKKLYTLYNNRASEKNLTVLNDLIRVRTEIANLLGYKTFAEYQIEERMAKTPKAVWDFENNLIDKVKQKAKIDYDELLEIKRNYTNDQSASVIQPWESSFYSNLLLIEKYSLDQNLVKEYFELNNVLNGLFSISQHLFDVQFEEVKNPSVWHKDVRMFNVKQDGKIISMFYLDLHPRDNKFSHAACFPMISGKLTDNGYQKPVATLVCNFPQATENQPALMPQSDVETFFHEFGHVLHSVLTKAELSSFSGSSVARDFVEAPSQIFENWVWDYEALKLFARHYKTNEVLPVELHKKMVAAKNVGSGIQTLQQIFYGLIDMTYHDKFNPDGSKTTTDVLKELQNSVTLYPYLEGTNMQASFGHLTGYAAGYYGYMWARVYAQDMFSVFEKNGIMDKKTGIRYRDIILAKGGEEKEIDLVKQFLGREPNEEAFMRYLGL